VTDSREIPELYIPVHGRSQAALTAEPAAIFFQTDISKSQDVTVRWNLMDSAGASLKAKVVGSDAFFVSDVTRISDREWRISIGLDEFKKKTIAQEAVVYASLGSQTVKIPAVLVAK
jgi:hypothetical protein